ncbi:ArsR/SmtB family transcription factor [Galactobacter valiniphilus]|uniref:ArsR/SmtB family transcription factor n=1 Tax=Galactobacter valiniphilus TaxID=2676122 RepID=UPI003735B236
MHAHNDEPLGIVEPEFVDLAAEVFTLLSDPTRIRILLELDRAGELAVGELAAALEKPRTGVSQHLARLRMARMVTTRHEGTKVLYALVDEHPVRVIAEAVRQAEHTVADGTQPPRHHRPQA